MVVLYTIGFTKKNAKDFFNKLRQAKVKKVIDIRLNNNSQLAGFTKKDDLAFFLQELCNCQYEHRPDWAPTKEILDRYKKKEITWADYEKLFATLLSEKNINETVALENLDRACLLFSEATPEKCHRRLVAEYLKKIFADLTVKHL